MTNPDSPNIFHFRWLTKSNFHRAKFHGSPVSIEHDTLLDEVKYSNMFLRYDYYFQNRF